MKHLETMRQIARAQRRRAEAAEARVVELEREVEVLRAWGNKDTIALADEELAQRREHPAQRRETEAERLGNRGGTPGKPG